MLKEINRFFRNNTYIIYLCTLIFWIGFLPLFEVFGIIGLLEFIIGNIIFISAFYFFYHREKKIQAYVILPLVVLFSYAGFFFQEIELLGKIERLLLFVLFTLITIHLLQRIFKHKEVDQKVIIISITAYIMLGFMFSILCWFICEMYPGAYNSIISEEGHIVDFTYYTIITMSTLGYGDIVPILPQSKALAIVITLVGQFYMAILVAFLIGKFLNRKK